MISRQRRRSHKPQTIMRPSENENEGIFVGQPPLKTAGVATIPKPPKRGFMEAVAVATMAAIPPARQAAQLAYKNARGKDQRLMPDMSRGQNVMYTDTVLTQNNNPYRETDQQKYLVTSPIHSSRTQQFNVDPAFPRPRHAARPAGNVYGATPRQDPETQDTGDERTLKPSRSLDSMMAQANNFTTGGNETPSFRSGNDQYLADSHTLLRIMTVVWEAVSDHHELKGPKGETPLETISRILAEYAKQAKILSVKTNALNEANIKVAKIRKMELDLGTTENSLRASRTKLLNTETRLKKAEASLQEQETLYEHTISQLTIDKADIQSEYKGKLQKEQQKSISDRAELQKHHQDEIRQVRHDATQEQALELSNLRHDLREQDRQWRDHVSGISLDWQRRLRESEEKNRQDREEEEDKRTQITLQHSQAIYQEQQRYQALEQWHNSESARTRVHAEKTLAELKETHASEMREEHYKRDAIITQHSQAMYQEQQRYENLKNQHAYDLAMARSNAEGEKSRLEEEVENLKTQHISNLEDVKETAEKERVRLKNELQAEKTKVNNERNRRKEELQKQAKTLAKVHETETSNLREEHEKLKFESFQRVHFAALKDRDLASRFATITDGVDDFSNLDWDIGRQRDWPYTESQMLQIHRNNIRILKKHILQNTLWHILFDHIFRSPFKIIGTAAMELDEFWSNMYAPGVSSLEWDDVPIEVEKQRYETAKSFLTAINPSAPASSDMEALKISYEATITSLLNSLYRALERVARLGARDRRVLESLVRVCAKTWIECSAQPYRLVMSLPKGSGDLLAQPRGLEPPLKLVTKPELKRYGNAQGESLNRGQLVTDSQAAFETYPKKS